MPEDEEDVPVEVGYRVEATKDFDKVGIFAGMVGTIIAVTPGQSFTVVFPELTNFPNGVRLYWANRIHGFRLTPD
jgi:hypothetical protein